MKKLLVWLKDYHLADLLKIVIVLGIAMFFFSTFFFTSVSITGGSMLPTLKDGEIGISNIFSANNSEIERFDIVVLKTKEEGQTIKRVVALPNETIHVEGDQLYINGELVREPFLDKKFIALHTMENKIPFTQDFGPVTLQEDEYFVLGDNRLNSKDSRNLGAFHRKDIIAKDVIILFPFDQMRIEGSD